MTCQASCFAKLLFSLGASCKHLRDLPPKSIFTYTFYFRLLTMILMMVENNDTSSSRDAVNHNTSSQRSGQTHYLHKRRQRSKSNNSSSSILPDTARQLSSQPHSETCLSIFIFPHFNSSNFLNITLSVSLSILGSLLKAFLLKKYIMFFIIHITLPLF